MDTVQDQEERLRLRGGVLEFNVFASARPGDPIDVIQLQLPLQGRWGIGHIDAHHDLFPFAFQIEFHLFAGSHLKGITDPCIRLW